jgi:hypothetical protein
MLVKKELIEDDCDSRGAQAFSKRADALLLLVVSLSITDEDF